jgi:hypothetical protein
VARLRRALRERDLRVYELESRLAALEGSTTVQAARLVAGAGRRRAKGAVLLPRQLYRLWKHRTRPRSGPVRDQPRPAGFDRVEDRLLVPDPYEGLVVAGVLHPATAEALEEHAKVVRLVPHAAAETLDAADVDLLVVDARAGEPGTPWAYLGVPGVYDREQALLDLREVAQARGLPTVLWGADAPPALTRLPWDHTATATGDPAAALATLPVPT